MTWRNDAQCRGKKLALFFPIGTEGPALRETAEAKAVCEQCPVTAECRDEALKNGEVGIWGGMTEDERRAYKRRTQKRTRRQQAA